MSKRVSQLLRYSYIFDSIHASNYPHDDAKVSPKNKLHKEMALLATKPTSWASLAGPASATRNILSSSDSCAIASVDHRSRCIAAKPPLHHAGCLDVISASAESRPNPCQEVISMGRNQTCKLMLCRSGPLHNEGEEDKCGWEVFGREGEDIDCDVCVWVVLRECVGEGEDERLEEHVAAKNLTTEQLFTNKCQSRFRYMNHG